MTSTNTNNYPDIGAEFQYQVIKLLNNTLKNYKLSEQVRKDICNRFICDFSIMHDEGQILGNNKNYNLRFVFENQDEILYPTQSFTFHSIATENTIELFENEDSLLTE